MVTLSKNQASLTATGAAGKKTTEPKGGSLSRKESHQFQSRKLSSHNPQNMVSSPTQKLNQASSQAETLIGRIAEVSAAKQGNPPDSRKGKKDGASNKAESLTKHQRRAIANLHKHDDPNTTTSKH